MLNPQFRLLESESASASFLLTFLLLKLAVLLAEVPLSFRLAVSALYD